MTPLQLDPSAHAPCSSTIVGFAAAVALCGAREAAAACDAAAPIWLGIRAATTASTATDTAADIARSLALRNFRLVRMSLPSRLRPRQVGAVSGQGQASAITSSRPARRSSARPPGSVMAARSVLVPMQHSPLCEISVIIAAQPGSGPNGYIWVIRDPATYTGYGTPGTLDTCTSLVLVSRPETAAMTGAGSQLSAGASAPDTASAAVALAVRAVSTNCRTAATLAAGSGSAMGVTNLAPVNRLPPCGSSWVRRLIGNPMVSLSSGAPCRSW